MIDEKKIMASLHPEAKERFLKFINTVEKGGYTVFLTSGYRSFQKQKELRDQFEAGKVPAAARPGYSYHNYGLAIDLNLIRNGKRYGLRTPREDWIKTGVPEVAKRMGLRWGGDFKDNVHFDYPIYTTAVLLEKAKKQFGSIEQAKGNELNLA